MSPEEIFWAALELPKGIERSEYLDRACQNNEALKKEVESLLQSHEQAGSFLQQPIISPARAEVPNPKDDRFIGTSIGPYRLTQVIGQGGMGVVYVAEQVEPVRRRVALKLIKPEFTSRGVIARFEAERQALAIMDHPNIARVVDGGTTDQGRPYFVMELVKGIPITDYCDRAKLGPRQRLELVISVCHAVQHAHQKGIIHRDLKPTNVLVAEYDGRPVPKVIDFGVAKAVDAPLSDLSIHTDFGAVVGTLEYMSPEQAGLNQLDIDTRSDVYSLGVLLYELLTGTTPISRSQFGNAAFFDALRMIRELEPEKPSTRISSVEQAPTIAANRSTEPIRLSGLVRGDLDWIAMKALAKERLRRYQTAKDLADDLQRYLNHEPVAAGPPSFWYRARKHAMRHRAWFAIATTALVAAVAVFTGSLINTARVKSESDRRLAALELLRLERDAKDEALQQAARDRDAKSEALEAEQLARRQADLSSEKAVLALQTLTDETIDRLLDAQPGLTPANREFLNRIVEQLESFLVDSGSSVTARVVQADSLNQIGNLKARLGDFSGAVTSFEQAIAIWKPLVEEVKNKPEYRRGLADAHSNLGVHLASLQRFEESEESHLQAIAIHEQLAAEFPANLDYSKNVANCRNSYGVMLKDVKRNAETMQQYELAIGIYQRVLSADPSNPSTLVDLANVRNNYSIELYLAGKHEESLLTNAAMIESRRKLIEVLPDEPDERYKLAMALLNRAMFQQAIDRTLNSKPLLEEALSMMGEVLEKYPGVYAYRQGLVQVLQHLADHHIANKQYDQVLPILQRRFDLLTQLCQESPERFDLARDRGHCQSLLATSNSRLGNHPQSVKHYLEAIKILEAVCTTFGQRLESHFLLANCRLGLAGTHQKLEQWEPSIAQFELAIQSIDAREANSEREPQYLAMKVSAFQELGWSLFQLKRFGEAAEKFSASLEPSTESRQTEWQLKKLRNLVELDWQAASEQLDAIPPERITTGTQCLLAARIYAALAQRQADPVKQTAANTKAVEFLQRAQKLNYFTPPRSFEELERIADFESLRNAEIYTNWLESVNGG